MNDNREETENAEGSTIKNVLIKTVSKFLVIPVSILLALFVAVALWTSGGSSSRRRW